MDETWTTDRWCVQWMLSGCFITEVCTSVQPTSFGQGFLATHNDKKKSFSRKSFSKRSKKKIVDEKKS